MWRCVGVERVYIGSCWGNRRERGHSGDLGVGRLIIFGRNFRRWNVVIWIELGIPRTETADGCL